MLDTQPYKIPKNCVLVFLLILSSHVYSADIQYKIQPGDTLYSISRSFGLDYQVLMNHNNIANERSLKVGQVIAIPDNNFSSQNLEMYKIQGGDTIYSISRRTGMSVEDILTFNNLTPDDIIRPGQVLQLLPSTSIAKTTSTPAQAQTISSSSQSAEEIRTPGRFFWPHNGERFVLSGKFPGIVIKGSLGDTIHAVSNGRVVYSGPHSTLAEVVFIQNSKGYIYIYGGNRSLNLSTGDEVRVGDVVGTLGPSPLLPEVQVYFSAWKDGKYVDPNISPR